MIMEGSSDNSLDEHPTGERWDPLGAPNDDEDFFRKLNCSEDQL